MKKGTKIWLITAVVFIVVGCILLGGVMTMVKWDFSKLSTNNYQTNTHELHEMFKNASIVTNVADITFVASENAACRVECYEEENAKHLVWVKDDTLFIEVEDTRKWYEHIGINFQAPKVTVYLPQGDYSALSIKTNTADVQIPKDFCFASMDISTDTGSVKSCASAPEGMKIKTSTGNICVENAAAGTLDLSVSTGKVLVSGMTCTGDVKIKVSTGKASITDTKCPNMLSWGDTGDISLKNVLVKERCSIERSTGDVRFDGADAAEIFVKTDTGDVKGSLRSDKVFMVETDTGSVHVPKTIKGGKCEIITDTGDVYITVK